MDQGAGHRAEGSSLTRDAHLGEPRLSMCQGQTALMRVSRCGSRNVPTGSQWDTEHPTTWGLRVWGSGRRSPRVALCVKIRMCISSFPSRLGCRSAFQCLESVPALPPTPQSNHFRKIQKNNKRKKRNKVVDENSGHFVHPGKWPNSL